MVGGCAVEDSTVTDGREAAGVLAARHGVEGRDARDGDVSGEPN